MENVNLLKLNFDTQKSMVFYSRNQDVVLGAKAIVETMRGYELGEIVTITAKKQEDINLTGLNEILRLATLDDLDEYEHNFTKAKSVVIETQKQSDLLALKMKIINASFTLDSAKLTINYSADERIDFRDLLKILAAKYHCRIDLRQIGARDKAQMVGGIGVCGLELCCHRFLDQFEGITINMAKNQMLSLNLPKISGQCEKLICCLKYEDDTYKVLKEELPHYGDKARFENTVYTIISVNVISQVLKLSDDDRNIKYAPLASVKLLDYDKK